MRRMQQMAGNLGILNPFMFNQFNAYSPFTTVHPVSCRTSSPSVSPTSLMQQPSISLSQLMMQQAAGTLLTTGSGGGYLTSALPNSLSNSLNNSTGSSSSEYSHWGRSGPSSKLMCHPYSQSSLPAAHNSPVSSPIQPPNTTSSPAPDFLCNGQPDLYSSSCLSGLIQCMYFARVSQLAITDLRNSSIRKWR